MALDIPTTAEEVIQRAKVDVQRSVQGGVDPFNKNNVITAVVTAYANRVFDFYAQLQLGIDESLPDTADILLERWAAIFGKTIDAATQSTGAIVATGTAASSIPLTTILVDDTGATYEVTEAATVTAGNTVTASSVTRVGSMVTFVTATPHGLSNNVVPTISGADQIEYNVTDAEINVTDAFTFTYALVGTPITPATGTIIATFTSSINGLVESVESGAAFNLAPEETLTLSSAIAGIDNVVGIAEPGFTGGTDVEDSESLRTRMLDKIQNPVAHFNASDITEISKTVAGVTRVFVDEPGDPIGTATLLTSQVRVTAPAEGTIIVAGLVAHGFVTGDTVFVTASNPSTYDTPTAPATGSLIIVIDADTFIYQVDVDPGQTINNLGSVQGSVSPGAFIVYPMTDGATPNGIPSAGTLTNVTTAILTIKPVNTADSDVNVVAAVPVAVNVEITDLTPDTPSLRTAVINNVEQFFAEVPIVGMDITDEGIIGAIQNTIDPNTGQTIVSFSLTDPSGDTTINPGEIAVSGAITFVTT